MGNHALHQKHSLSAADKAKYCHTALLGEPPIQNSDDREGIAGDGTDVDGGGATAGDGSGTETCAWQCGGGCVSGDGS